MGLFDYVFCDYPLPGNPPECASGVAFQTKDLTCYMMQYTIQADGSIVEKSGKEDLSDLTATIDLDWSNVVATGPGIYTKNGEDAQYLEYQVMFVHGKVAAITEVNNASERAAKVKHRAWPEITPEDQKRIDERQSESLIGRGMWLWWGSLDPDYKGDPVTVITENDREWLVQSADGEFEKVHRGQRDNCFFDSYEDGKRHKDERNAEWAAERAEYEAEISAKQ
jgi:hypothetical protein